MIRGTCFSFPSEIVTLQKVASLDVSQHVGLQDLDKEDKSNLQVAALRYREEGILEQWLLDEQLHGLFKRYIHQHYLGD